MLILEKLIFYFLIFTLPLQTRKILEQWGGDFNEWTSAYLYITDILLILLFVLCFWRLRGRRFLKKMPRRFLGHYGLWLLVFAGVSLVSIAGAGNLQIGFYSWVKLLEFIGFFLYLRHNAGSIFNIRGVAKFFVASGLAQALIAFCQFARQSDLGLKWAAESPLSPDKAGVAKIAANGLKLIRPYGTMPHPNVLAAFLFVSLFFCYFLWLDNKKRSAFSNCFLLGAYGFLLFALWLTFSRMAIAVFVLMSIVYLFVCFLRARQTGSKKILQIAFVFILCSLLFIACARQETLPRFQISAGEQAVSLRGIYNEIALESISAYPLLGIGLGNFVWQIRQSLFLFASWLHQPVHNLYLLIAVETGLIGLVALLLFIWRLVMAARRRVDFTAICPLCILASFLLMALSDHFFWTLQQGQLMFWLVLGLLAGTGKRCAKNGESIP